MPLYQVQDDDRPLFIMAEDFGDAERKWKAVIRDENEGEGTAYDASCDVPKGIVFLASNDDVVIGERPEAMT